jgi:quinol monooxygenase YgiN
MMESQSIIRSLRASRSLGSKKSQRSLRDQFRASAKREAAKSGDKIASCISDDGGSLWAERLLRRWATPRRRSRHEETPCTGCLSYIIAKDTNDANAIWITKAWDGKASHDASLSLPTVRDAIGRGRPLIAGFSDGVVTTPVGGHGLLRQNG